MLGGRLIKPLARAILGERYILAKFLWRQWCQEQPYYKIPAGVLSIRRLREFKDIHKGERCVIIGNGPSLINMDLSLLDSEITFGLNRIYLLEQMSQASLNYYVCVNPLVLEQFSKDIKNIRCPKFLSFKGYKYFQPQDDLLFLNSLPRWAFSTDITKGICEGYTVTYVAMQIAYYMGFTEIVLIGVDHNFESKGEPNKEIVMDRPDYNHFSTDYFHKGIRWQLPDLENSEIAYRMAKVAFARNGRRILDATLGGRLNVFPKVDYKQYFGPAKPNRVTDFA
jgi:hypothetical protein